MGCLLPLLLISITSITCAFLYVYQNSPQQFQSIVFGKWWAPLAFAAGIFSVAYFSLFIIFHIFGETTFSINAQFLIIKKIFSVSLKQILFREKKLNILNKLKMAARVMTPFLLGALHWSPIKNINC